MGELPVEYLDLPCNEMLTNPTMQTFYDLKWLRRRQFKMKLAIDKYRRHSTTRAVWLCRHLIGDAEVKPHYNQLKEKADSVGLL